MTNSYYVATILFSRSPTEDFMLYRVSIVDQKLENVKEQTGHIIFQMRTFDHVYQCKNV